MIRTSLLGFFAVATTAALGCGSSPAASTASSSSSSSSASSSSSGTGGTGPAACGASQGVTAVGSMDSPPFGVGLTCAVSSVVTAPDLAVSVACPDTMGGPDVTLTMTIQAKPAITTDLKKGDKVGLYYQSQNVEGPEIWAAFLDDATKELRLGFVDAGTLGGVGSPNWHSPLIATDDACPDDKIRHAVTFDYNGAKTTVPDGQRGVVGAKGEYVVQVQTAHVDPSSPSMPGHYTIVAARQ